MKKNFQNFQFIHFYFIGTISNTNRDSYAISLVDDFLTLFFRYICRKLAESCNLTLLDDRNNDLIIARDKIRELEMTVAKLREELYKSKREKLGKKHKE